MAVAGRLGDRGPLSAPVGGRWLSIRLGLAACTAAVVVTGHVAGQLAGMHGRLDDGFFALLLLDLLPVLVYAIGTHGAHAPWWSAAAWCSRWSPQGGRC